MPTHDGHRDAPGESAPLGIPIIATFHPAYILRQTGGAMTEVKRLVWNDLKAVRDRLRAVPNAQSPEQHTLFE